MSKTVSYVTRNAIGNQPDLDPEKFVEHTIASKRRAFPGASAAAQAIVTLNVSDFGDRVLPGSLVTIGSEGQRPK